MYLYLFYYYFFSAEEVYTRREGLFGLFECHIAEEYNACGGAYIAPSVGCIAVSLNRIDPGDDIVFRQSRNICLDIHFVESDC